MNALDAAIMALTISQAIDIQRLDASEREKVMTLLSKLERDLTVLLSTRVLSEMGKRNTAAVLREVTALIQETYTEASMTAIATGEALAPIEATRTLQALESVLKIDLGTKAMPTVGYLEKLAGDVLIQGSPAAEWWSKQAGDVVFRFSQQLRLGLVAGETNTDIIARIIGTDEAPGVMQIAQKNAAALVHSSVQTVANSARLATYRKNSDIIKGVRYLATLDNLTCEVCGAHDGMEWDLDGKPMNGNTLPFVEPPLHIGCRCVLTSVLRPMSEISGGALPDIPNNGTRASSHGQVSASTTFADWFKMRTPAQRAEQFGKARAELYDSGKLSLRDMLDMSGRPLSVEQLRAKIKP
jgi:SPP1 gp7 family putative phage head morphogenesis protein